MAKVLRDDDDLIVRVGSLELRAMRLKNGTLPAKDWYDALDNKGKGQVAAAVGVLESTILRGRPPAGRAEKISISACGLWELKPTKPGGRAPHLRMLFLREGNVLWAAVGFAKQKNKLAAGEINAGDAAAREWLEQRER